MAKKSKARSEEGCAERAKQFGAVVEFGWFFLATVGSFIHTGDCNHEAAHDSAAHVREHAEELAKECEDLFPF
jgi:hypothetical protein